MNTNKNKPLTKTTTGAEPVSSKSNADAGVAMLCCTTANVEPIYTLAYQLRIGNDRLPRNVLLGALDQDEADYIRKLLQCKHDDPCGTDRSIQQNAKAVQMLNNNLAGKCHFLAELADSFGLEYRMGKLNKRRDPDVPIIDQIAQQIGIGEAEQQFVLARVVAGTIWTLQVRRLHSLIRAITCVAASGIQPKDAVAAIEKIACFENLLTRWHGDRCDIIRTDERLEREQRKFVARHEAGALIGC